MMIHNVNMAAWRSTRSAYYIKEPFPRLNSSQRAPTARN